MEHVERFQVEAEECGFVLTIETDEQEPRRMLICNLDEVVDACRPIFEAIAEREYHCAAYHRATPEEREAVLYGHSIKVLDENLRDPEAVYDWADAEKKRRRENP